MTAAPHLEWEGIARDLSEATANDEWGVDAFVLAKCCGFNIVASSSPRAVLDEEAGEIHVDLSMHPRKLHIAIAHELGHWGQRRAGMPDTELGARYIGGGLMMPWLPMRRAARQVAWSIVKLAETHQRVSPLALAVRLAQTHDAVITAFDPRGRKRLWRYPSPWLADARLRERPTAWERDLAREAWAAQSEVRGDELCYAVPVVDYDANGEDRVIVVCELEQLSLRL